MRGDYSRVVPRTRLQGYFIFFRTDLILYIIEPIRFAQVISIHLIIFVVAQYPRLYMFILFYDVCVYSGFCLEAEDSVFIRFFETFRAVHKNTQGEGCGWFMVFAV